MKTAIKTESRKKPSPKRQVSEKTKKASTKSNAMASLTCPVNGAGWCPYPFSVAQLERRMKEKMQKQAEAVEAKSSAKVRTKAKPKAQTSS